jgi:hypothetical protein
MSRISIFRLVCFTLPLLINSAKSQPDRFAYAVTAVNKGGTEWVALRKLDMSTGEFSSVLLNVQDSDQRSVAAIAYDRRGNRLFYTAMNKDQLRYIDLSTMESYAVPGQFFSKAGNYEAVNAGPINRMVIAPDDYGYTITNDGNHLLRFSTIGTPVLRDMGDLVDDPLNQEWTIHSICSNSGGDLIADDAGHLFLVTGSNRVYKVDITTRITSYIATVSGLPQKFATSGLAVNENGNRLIAISAVSSEAPFLIDPETWAATAIPSARTIYESADLANSNVLHSNANTKSGLFISKNPENPNGIRIFPNPVLDDVVSIQFNQLPPGNYTIQLADLLGTKLSEQKATIVGQSQIETLHIPHSASQTFYYVRILDERNNQVSIQKLIVERW